MNKIKYINEDFMDVHGDPVYEMADDLKKYRQRLLGYSQELYYHVIYVTVLGNQIPYVEHWKNEIANFCKPVFFVLKSGCRNIDRSEYIRSEMMAPMMGEDFEDYDVEHFRDALDDEIRSGEKMLSNPDFKNNWKKIRREVGIIKQIRNNLDGIPDKCLDSIRAFYDGLCAAASANDKERFLGVLDELKPVI